MRRAERRETVTLRAVGARGCDSPGPPTRLRAVARAVGGSAGCPTGGVGVSGWCGSGRDGGVGGGQAAWGGAWTASRMAVNRCSCGVVAG